MSVFYLLDNDEKLDFWCDQMTTYKFSLELVIDENSSQRGVQMIVSSVTASSPQRE